MQIKERATDLRNKITSLCPIPASRVTVAAPIMEIAQNFTQVQDATETTKAMVVLHPVLNGCKTSFDDPTQKFGIL